ncbi:MAG: leucine-rich repeat protein, partial [Spirochaetales bacterium]|nr:leucine-rich repeat protein [Spirochaetales bacterium]
MNSNKLKLFITAFLLCMATFFMSCTDLGMDWETGTTTTSEGFIITYDSNGAAVITGYEGSDTAVTVPSSVTVDGVEYSVTGIASEAFKDNTSITSVSVADTVTSIGSSAFSGCTAVTSVTLSNSITSISASTFENCSSLTTITIPESVTSIGDSAFSGCTSITSYIVEGSSPATLGTDSFDGASDYIIYVPSDSVTTYQSSWSDYSDHIAAQTSAVVDAVELTIEDITFSGTDTSSSVTTGFTLPVKGEVNGSTVTWVSSNTDVITIGDDGTTTVTRPTSDTNVTLTATITDSDGNTITKTITVTVKASDSESSEGTNADEDASALTVDDVSFTDGDSSTSVTSSFTLPTTGEKNSSTITWASSNTDVVTIGENGATTVTRPSSDTDITLTATITDSDGNTTTKTITVTVKAYEVTDPSDFYYDFDNSSKTATVIQYIGLSTDIVIPSQRTYNEVTYTITSVGNTSGSSRKFNTNLISVVIPDTVISINEQAFRGHENLESVTIPDSVTSIGNLTFCGCT